MTPHDTVDNAQMMIHLGYIKDSLQKVELMLQTLPQMNNDIGKIKQTQTDQASHIIKLFEKSDGTDIAVDQVRSDVAKAISFSRGATWVASITSSLILALIIFIWQGELSARGAGQLTISQLRDSLSKLENRVTIHDFQIGTQRSNEAMTK